MRLKWVAFTVIGIGVGVVFANFRVPDYYHATVVLKEGGDSKPIYISENKGTKILALSVKNLQDSRDIEIKVTGGIIHSSYPPPVILPFRKWISVEGNVFRGLRYGMKLPLYVVLDGEGKSYELSFVRVTDGKPIKKVSIMAGGKFTHGSHH